MRKSKVTLLTQIAVAAAILLIISSSDLLAQTDPSAKIQSAAKSFSDTVKVVVNAVIPSVLGIGLITVIWMVNQNKPNAKEFIIGWLVAAIFWGIAATIINF